MSDENVKQLDDTAPQEFVVSDEERSNLSKVLFPDTHTDKVTLLGKERTVKALPIKYSKMIRTKLEPIAKKIGESVTAEDKNAVIVGNDELVDALREVAVILSNFYGWPDVKERAEAEELTASE